MENTMEESLKRLKSCISDVEKALPAVVEDPVKNRKSYKVLREQTMAAMQEIKAIRYHSLEKFNKIWYEKHPKKEKNA